MPMETYIAPLMSIKIYPVTACSENSSRESAEACGR